MLNIEKTPKEFLMARQTIPFIVSTSLFDTITFDPIEKSFKYLFDVKTLRDDGTYQTFTTVAIPPRPDNLVGFFDPSKIIKSAIAYDNGTHKLDKISPMPFSIVQFRVICTERYLDDNGVYINGDTINLGTYYAIDAGSTEGIEPYLITTGTTKDAMHHHELLGNQFVLYPKEPLTVSFLTKPSIEGNIFEEIHGDYGSFDKGDVLVYTGITASNNVNSLSKTTSPALSGAALKAHLKTNAFITTDQNGPIIRFSNLDLNPNTEYRFSIFCRLISSSFLDVPSGNAYYEPQTVGAGIDTIEATTTASIRNSRLQWYEITQTFTTNNSLDGNEYIEIAVITTINNDLTKLNNKNLIFDSAVLTEITTPFNNINKARIVVNQDLLSEISHELPDSYLEDVIGFDQISKARFDCPIGANSTYTAFPYQDTNTGFWLDNNGDIGLYFHIELFDEADPTEVIAKCDRVYQSKVCDRYNSVRLKWLNELGAWDYYTFTKVSIASTIAQKDNYKITYGKIYKPSDQNSFDYIEDDTSRGYKGLTVLSDDYIVINTDWVKNETSKFLKGLLTSPEVYILNPEPYIDVPVTQEYELEYPVIVEDSEFEFRNNSMEAKLVNVQFRIKIATPYNEKTTNIN